MVRKLFYERELTSYPMGRKRAWFLFIVILANFIAAYEAQISPVIPMLMQDLQMDLTTYGLIAAVSVVFAGASALIFGPLADRYGRVRFLVPSLLLTGVVVFSMVFVKSVMGLLLVRVILGIVEGASISTTAGLVRDFSPRMGRAMAYALWTFGPVGSNFFANGLAGWTLPIFGTWESQFYIQGIIALGSAIFIMLFISDLSPQLREQIVTGKEDIKQINKKIITKRPEEQKKGGMLSVPHIVALSIGISLFLTTYVTIQAYGATLLEQGFDLSNSQAAAVAKYFWLFNLFTLVIAGWISDKLMLRKIISLIGAIAAVLYMSYFASLFGSTISEGHLIIYTSLLGGLIGIAYGPWMALFSENAEDIKASLQASAWGLWGFAVRVVGFSVTLIAPIIVAAHGWGTWMWIAAVAGMIYIPLLFMGKGPWFRNQINDVTTEPAVTPVESTK
ncbi:MFS transporter [Lentibacillus sp. N15]|uniref:MFS transporter n=1 Tax=Lentibacillus songyuanensis TaxID=3136161 RepID=UPI0031BB037A